jgi:sugar phosphate permease
MTARHPAPRLPIHHAWAVVVVTFLVLLAAAGVRAAPGVLIIPLETEFGWSRAEISLAVAVGILGLGLGAPVSGALIDRFGPTRIMLGGLTLIVSGLVPLLFLRELWQLHVFWGVITGLGTGAVTNVLGATIALRWFRSYRGVIIGLFASASSAGQLIFIPTLVAVALALGWRGAVTVLVVAAAMLIVPVLVFMRDSPADVGREPVGSVGGEAERTAERADAARFTPLRTAVRTGDFWLLAGSFFICGYTSNGLIGTHLIPHAVEHGFTEVTAASAVALMGAMNIAGTLASGWLTDRFDNRRLLAAYYGFRAISIAALPFILDVPLLFLFAIVYGLDWIATVPPTANLTAKLYGRGSLGTIYGWIFFSHMAGAALAAYIGGFFRDVLGDYHAVFISAALLGFVAVALSMRISIPGAAARAQASAPS